MNKQTTQDSYNDNGGQGGYNQDGRRGTNLEPRLGVNRQQTNNQSVINSIIQRSLLGGESSNLWKSILNDVAQRDDIKESHLLVLGDRGAGKKSLVSCINKHYVRATNKFIDVDKMGSQFAGLDSSFLYVKDLSEKDALNSMVSSEDNLPRMNCWILQEQEKADLIKLVLKPEDLQQTCALIVLDFDQPWEMMNALQRWMGVLGETILDIMKMLKSSEQDKMKEKLTRFVKNFERKDDSNDNDDAINKNKLVKMDTNLLDEDEKLDDDFDDYKDLKSRLPLPEGVLKVNLGIPIIVVCQKIDLLLRGDKSQLLELNLEFIQKHLRQYCLSYAASLIFTEVNQLTNIELLYRYILHRLYDQEFHNKAEMHQKDSIFIPTGFDSLMLIDALCKGAYSEGKVYEEVIKKPSIAQQGQNKPEVTCEDWQIVLQKQFGMRRNLGGHNAAISQLSGNQLGGPGQAAGRPMDEKSKKDMAGFFQGLINKGSSRPKPTGQAPGGDRRGAMPQLDSSNVGNNGQVNGQTVIRNPLASAQQNEGSSNPSSNKDVLQSLRDRHSKPLGQPAVDENGNKAEEMFVPNQDDSQ
ncbi:cytoplasmic dynein 1 light intermediate chain 2 [Stylonychia lemnae]|uniref:Dynein light intermediate chain n=1 Tax=Stylonychia lemnae TaxID=5949 RepID=A0A078A5G8_STYLE|nr:cytoplasmic dynein 1 light intermediate chain 2 [Stylonychia lemnae]|eukprot:CDW77480.1 cytoplasmic dynein 1 light intermediate chain 2 [Stylonychia lemnae]